MGILILLFLNSANADIVSRMNAISYDNFRDAAIKCGYKPRNFSLFAKAVVNKNQLAKMTCIESKVSEVISDRVSASNDADNRRAAKQRMQLVDCETRPNQYQRDVCYLLK